MADYRNKLDEQNQAALGFGATVDSANALADFLQRKQLHDSNQQFELQKEAAKRAAQQEATQRNLKTAQDLVDQYRRQGVKIGANIGDSGSVSITQSEMDPIGKQIGNAIRGAEITGYDIADPNRVIPTPKDAEQVKQATSGFKALAQGKDRLVGKIQDASTLDRLGTLSVPFVGTLGTQRGKEIDSEIGDMLMQAKNLEQLGALQAGEIKLMERIQGSATGLGSLFQNKGEVIKRLNEIVERGKSRVNETATARGYRAQPGYLDTAPAQTAKINEMRQAQPQQPTMMPASATQQPVDPRQRLEELRNKYRR